VIEIVNGKEPEAVDRDQGESTVMEEHTVNEKYQEQQIPFPCLPCWELHNTIL
jgi:hypothetical protein